MLLKKFDDRLVFFFFFYKYSSLLFRPDFFGDNSSKTHLFKLLWTFSRVIGRDVFETLNILSACLGS